VTVSPVLATLGVAILGALLTLLGVLIGQLWGRLTALENRVESATAYNRRLWEWARRHLDLYYLHRRDGAPDPQPIPDEHG
jgi:hypothetical protein